MCPQCEKVEIISWCADLSRCRYFISLMLWVRVYMMPRGEDISSFNIISKLLGVLHSPPGGPIIAFQSGSGLDLTPFVFHPNY